MNILLWLILGALSGWIASMIMGTNNQQGLFTGRTKAEAVGHARIRILQIVYCIGQSANRVHHRYRAIAQTVHLVQTTGLKSGRHQKNIGAGGNPMGEPLVVTKRQGNPAGPLRRQLLQGRLVAGFTGTQ